jgi:hypothetical protein
MAAETSLQAAIFQKRAKKWTQVGLEAVMLGSSSVVTKINYDTLSIRSLPTFYGWISSRISSWRTGSL